MRSIDLDPVAVLVSGGLDSAILLGELLEQHQAVYPLYVRCGLRWEEVELRHLKRFLAAIPSPVLQLLHVLEMPVADLYGDHWSLRARCAGCRVSDEAVTSQVAMRCACPKRRPQRPGVPPIALGTWRQPAPRRNAEFLRPFSTWSTRRSAEKSESRCRRRDQKTEVMSKDGAPQWTLRASAQQRHHCGSSMRRCRRPLPRAPDPTVHDNEAVRLPRLPND